MKLLRLRLFQILSTSCWINFLQVLAKSTHSSKENPTKFSEAELLAKDLVNEVNAYINNGDWDSAEQIAGTIHTKIKQQKPRSWALQQVKDTISTVISGSDDVVKFFNKKHALPTDSLCSVKWGQNSTDVLVVVRFAKTWDGPSARWG